MRQLRTRVSFKPYPVERIANEAPELSPEVCLIGFGREGIEPTSIWAVVPSQLGVPLKLSFPRNKFILCVIRQFALSFRQHPGQGEQVLQNQICEGMQAFCLFFREWLILVDSNPAI